MRSMVHTVIKPFQSEDRLSGGDRRIFAQALNLRLKQVHFRLMESGCPVPIPLTASERQIQVLPDHPAFRKFTLCFGRLFCLRDGTSTPIMIAN